MHPRPRHPFMSFASVFLVFSLVMPPGAVKTQPPPTSPPTAPTNIPRYLEDEDEHGGPTTPVADQPGTLPANPEPSAADPLAPKVIMFAADGMRPDMVAQYAAQGYVPTFAQMLAEGTRGVNGMMPIAPPNTGAGWYAMATGTFPGELGSTNNTFHKNGAAFNTRTSAFTNGLLTAETLFQSAERAGKRVLAFEWAGARNISPVTAGPAIDFRNFYSRRGVVVNYDLPGQPANANFFGVDYERVTLAPASGWITEPVHYGPALETTLLLTTTFAAANPNRSYFLYIYDSTDDSTTNYDTVEVVPTTGPKSITATLASLQQGDWADIKLAMSGTLSNSFGGWYVKLIDLSADASQFRFYFTSIARAAANTTALELAINNVLTLPTSIAGDFAPLEAGIVDEETYAEQQALWDLFRAQALPWLFGYYPNPDLVLIGNPLPDESQHQFLALVSPTAAVYDDVDRNGIPDNRVVQRTAFIRNTYISANNTLAHAKNLMPAGTTVFVGSDHGFAPTWYSVNPSRLLVDAGLQRFEQTSNCLPFNNYLTETLKVCYAGAAVQIYFNLAGRDPAATAQISATNYALSQTQVISAFMALNTVTQTVVAAAYRKAEMRTVPAGWTTMDMLHPTRTGDVVVFLAPPYQFDAATIGTVIADQPFFGQHGFLPDTVDFANNINLHATFLMWGPPIKAGTVDRVTQLDAAPTLAFLLGIPAPAQARGRILYEIINAPAAALTADFVTSSPDVIGDTTVFFNQSGGGAGALSYTWNFGDGAVITSTLNATHTYAAVGAYTVILTATDGLTTDVATRLVNIIPSNIVYRRYLPLVARTALTGTLAPVQAQPAVVQPYYAIPAPANTPLINSTYAEVSFATVSDFHGQIVSRTFSIDGLSLPVGGAPVLKTLFDELADANPGGTLYFTAGDSVGATPPQSSEFDDKPTIVVMNEWGFDGDALGNHNFDHGQTGPGGAATHAAEAAFPYLSANIVVAGTLTHPTWLKPYHIYDVDNYKVGVIGLTNEDAPLLVSPTAFEGLEVTDQVAAVNRYVPILRQQGVKIIVVIVHDGANTCTTLQSIYPLGYGCTGPVVDLANGLTPGDVDLILGDHTDIVLNQVTNGILLSENASRGVTYSDVDLTIDKRTGRVVYKTAQTHRAYNLGVAPDPTVESIVNYYVSALSARLSEVIGHSTVFIPRGDACGQAEGRTCESLVGNVATDALVHAYGVDFAFANSGGLRSDLTCPTTDSPTDFCPPYTPPPFPISRGQVNALLPFGNLAVTLQINGAELKTILENSVALMPAPNGRFLQVSGLCFTYNISNTVGTRIVSAVRQAGDGACTGAAIDLTSASNYMIAENDFMVNGGDGYPNFASRATTRDILDQAVADYVAYAGMLSPVIQNRIVCTANGTPNACPVVVP